jgi:hypothetical protein
MLKYLPTSASRPAAQYPQAIALQAITPNANSPQLTAANKAGHAENPLHEIFSIISADLAPKDLQAAMLVSKAWARGILQTPAWKALAEAVEMMTPQTAKLAAEPDLSVALRPQAPLSRRALEFSILSAGVLLSAAAGVGYGVANQVRLNEADKHPCAPYANLSVQVWTKRSGSTGYSDNAAGGNYVGNFQIDAQAACESAIGMQPSAIAVAVPFPAGFSSSQFRIEPSVIIPVQHHAWTTTQAAILAGTVAAPLIVAFLVSTLAKPIASLLLRHRQASTARLTNDLEAGHAAALARQNRTEHRELLAPGIILARYNNLKALVPRIHESIHKDRLTAIALFGPVFKAVDNATGSDVHQEFFAHAISKRNRVQIQTLLDQGALFDQSQLARLANPNGAPNTAAMRTLFEAQGQSTIGAQVASHLPDTALITLVTRFDTSVVRAFLAAAGENTSRFMKGQSLPQKRTALHEVAFAGHAETFALLQHHGADLDAEDARQATPRQLASLSASCRPLVNGGIVSSFTDVTGFV